MLIKERYKMTKTKTPKINAEGIRKSLIKKANAQISRAKENLTVAEKAREEVNSLDVEAGLFKVRIYDPWDGATSIGHECSCSATERGLARAISSCEREYKRRSGGYIRTDGVLDYSVYVELPSTSFSLAPDLWHTLTSQTLASLKKGNR